VLLDVAVPTGDLCGPLLMPAPPSMPASRSSPAFWPVKAPMRSPNSSGSAGGRSTTRAHLPAWCAHTAGIECIGLAW
jgi:hypothetical protein